MPKQFSPEFGDIRVEEREPRGRLNVIDNINANCSLLKGFRMYIVMSNVPYFDDECKVSG